MYIFLFFNIITIILYVFEGLFLNSEYIIALNIFIVLLRQIAHISDSGVFLFIIGVLYPVKIYVVILYKVNIVVLIVNETLMSLVYAFIILEKNIVVVPVETLYEDIATNISNCSICLENYEKKDSITLTKCSHLFHKECLTKWYDKNKNCPMCRTEFTSV